MKHEAIIIKVKKNYIIVLNDSNQYDKILKRGNLSVGMKVMYTDSDRIQGTVSRLNSKFAWKPAAAVAAAVLLAFGLLALPGLMKDDPMDSAVAMVIVDINPSVKLFINEDDEVIAAVPMNDDAKQLKLDDLHKYGTAEAIEIIINRAVEKGFLDVNDLDDDYVLLTEINLSDDDETEVGAVMKPEGDDDEKEAGNLRERLAQILLQSEVLQNVSIAMIEATLEQLDKAIENNVPAGLFAVDGGVNVNGTVMTVQEFFADDGLVAAFLAKGEILEQNFDNKLALLGTYLNLLDDDTVDKESLQQAFELAKNDFFEAKILYKRALDKYQDALKSGNEDAISQAKAILDKAETFKDQMEAMKNDLDTIKDALKFQMDKQELVDELDEDELERELEKLHEEEKLMEEKHKLDDDDDDDDMDDADDDDEDMADDEEDMEDADDDDEDMTDDEEDMDDADDDDDDMDDDEEDDDQE